MSSLRLNVDGRLREVSEAEVREVGKRRPDRWWDGALIGAGIGAVVGAVVKAYNCGSTDCGEGGLVDPGFYLLGAGIGAAAGALVDHSISRFDTVFVGPPAVSGRDFCLVPILSKDAQGLALSLRF